MQPVEPTEAKAGAPDPWASPVIFILSSITFTLQSPCDGGGTAFPMLSPHSVNGSVSG